MKFYFYYNKENGVIEEATLALNKSGALPFDGATGRVPNGTLGERHGHDVSTFIPLCYNLDEVHGGDQLVAARANTEFRFGFSSMMGAIFHKGQYLRVYYKDVAPHATLPNVAVYSPFVNDFPVAGEDPSGGGICDNVNENNFIDLQWVGAYVNHGIYYSNHPTLGSNIYLDDHAAYDTFDNDNGPVNKNDGLSTGGRTDGSGNYLPWDGVDSKIALMLGSNIVLQSGWYAIDIPDDPLKPGPADNVTDANNNGVKDYWMVIDGVDGVAGQTIDRPGGDDAQDRRWTFSQMAEWTITNMNTTIGIAPYKPFVSRTASISGTTITFDQVLKQEYTDFVPTHGNNMNVARKIGYVIWRQPLGGGNYVVDHHGVVNLTKGAGGNVTVVPNTFEGQFSITHTASQPGNYLIQFFQHEDTYRFQYGDTSVNISPTYQSYDRVINIYDFVVNDPNFSTRQPTDTGVTDAQGEDLQGMFPSNLGSSNEVSYQPFCDDDLYYFQISGGKLVTQYASIYGVLGCVSGGKQFDGAYNELFCDAAWNGVVYRKSTGQPFLSSAEICANDGSAEQIDVTVTGNRRPVNNGSLFGTSGDIIVKHNGSALADGYYAVCGPSSDGGILSQPVPNSEISLTTSVSGNVITANATSTSPCMNGVNAYCILRKLNPTTDVATSTMKTFANNQASFQFTVTESAVYSVYLYFGNGTSASTPVLHEGVDDDSYIAQSVQTINLSWCDGDPWWFEVDANGKLVTTVGAKALDGIRSCNGTDYGMIATNSTVFYCNATWSDNIFRKSGSGEWTSSTEVCDNNTEGEQLSNVTISGVSESTMASPDKGDIFIRENGSLLPAGYYGVCSPAVNSTTLNLTNITAATEDWSNSLSTSITGSSIVATVTRPTSCSDEILIELVNSSQQVVGSVTSSSANWANNVCNATFNISSTGTYEVKVKSTANTLEGLNAGIELDAQSGLTLTDWCSTTKWWFEVDSVGNIVTTSNNNIKAISDCTNNKIEFRANGFFCDVAWSGKVHRMADGNPWSGSAEPDLCTSFDTGEQIDITITGFADASVPNSKLIAKDTGGTRLPQGFYGVCDPSYSTDGGGTSRLTTPVPNASMALSANVSGQDITATATSAVTGVAANCFSGKSVHFTLVDSTDAVIQTISGSIAGGNQSQVTFTNLPSENYRVILKHGLGSDVAQSSILYEGIPDQYEFADVGSLQVVAPWCSDNLYVFRVSSGKIITKDANGRVVFNICDSVGTIQFQDGTYCDEPIAVYGDGTFSGWLTEADACASITATSIANLTIKGKQTATGGEIYISRAGVSLPDGWYAYCTNIIAGPQANIDVDPISPTPCDGYFIYISSDDGDWDGRVVDCNGIIVASVLTTSWFDESKLLDYRTKADGTTWPMNSEGIFVPPEDACLGCPDDLSSPSTLYVSGTLKDYTQESEKLRVYSSVGLQNPLSTGWYRSCSNAGAQPNGVAPVRPKFDCYGNPFIWYSTKNDSTTVTDDNSYLTNGDTPWFKDAPLKDLTTTGCDLAVAGWGKTGDTDGTTILLADYTSGLGSNGEPPSCSGITGHVIDFNIGAPYLTRSANYWYPNPETGQKIISLPKTSATEMTIAVLVDCESVDGTIFKITDVSTTKGYGEYDKLDELSAVLSTIKLEKVTVPNDIFPSYVLTTSNTDFSSTSESSISASSAISSPGHKYELIIIKLTTEGHTIRIGGGNSEASDSVPSNFCSAAGGITNLNVEIGADKDDANSAVDMRFAEMLIYDEELNTSEIEELEGYLSHKWCVVIPNNPHPYGNSGPDCGTCDEGCCESNITLQGKEAQVDGSSTTNAWRISCWYKSSDPVFGYQFFLTGLDNLDMREGFYASGDTIPSTVSGKEFQLSFDDPLSKSFLNYVEVTSRGVWVYGHFNQHSSTYGGFDDVLPKWQEASPLKFLTVYIKETSSSPSQNWGSLTGLTTITVSEAGFNHPLAPHPLLVTYDESLGAYPQVASATYTGDVTGSDSVSRVDTLEIIKRISSCWWRPPYNLSGTSWLETIDAIGKGWVDISDAVTCLLNVISGAGTHIGSPAPTIKPLRNGPKLLSTPVCSEKLTPTECLPCPCPPEPEEEDCVQKAWISDVQPLDHTGQFGIVTVRYQSSCCIDGYKLVLGGFNDKIINTSGGFHDGAVLVPSYGDSIGQLTDQSETHLRGWLHGLTLNPEYKGEVAFENVGEVISLNSNILGEYGSLADREFETKLFFPIVWGMSLGQNPLIPSTPQGKIDREDALTEGRLGINCIPATCKGESRVLTKFVVNLRSFTNPHIADFRLVTNDKAVTPCSFDSDPQSCTNITWTGDGNSDGSIGGADFAACLVYMYAGWGPNTQWDSSLNDPVAPEVVGPFTKGISSFDAEFDSSYIDIVDALTVLNHTLYKGGDADSDKLAPVVPTDCCPCDLPGSFTTTVDVNPCDCSEEGYVRGREGEVTITWTESADADGYVIYRVLEEQSEPSNQYSILNPFNYSSTVSLSLSNHYIDNLSTVAMVGGSSQTITDYQAVEAYKKKLGLSKNPLDFNKWVVIDRVPAGTTSVVDKNPPKFEKCCPDAELPKIKYIVEAFNDCGQKNAVASYYPECCGDMPEASDVDLGALSVNTLTSLYAKAYHPHALNPYGGVNANAEAKITIDSVPTTADTKLRLIKYDGTIVEIDVPQSGTPRIVAEDMVAAIIADDNFGVTIMPAPEPAFVIRQAEQTRCGNTKISVIGGDPESVDAPVSFAGGNLQCSPEVPGFPANCETLAFFITSISYSAPRVDDGLFVGPSGGGALPAGNLTGLWTWKPPAGYIGDVTFTYVVINESGCSDEATITVSYGPSKLILDCYSPPCDSDDYGKVIIYVELPSTDNLSQFIVMRKLTSDASEWDQSVHALTDSNGDIIKFNSTNYPDGVFKYVDDTVPVPDECCEDDISYDYVMFYCESSDLKVSAPTVQVQAQLTAQTSFVCTLSTVCTVVIPCCALPHNVLAPSAVVTQNCATSTDATVSLTWAPIAEADNPYLYIIFRKKDGDTTWAQIAEVDATPDGKNSDNPNWDGVNLEYFYNDTLSASKFCGDDILYSYAIVVIDSNKNASGNPKDESWDTGTNGDPCSPGGTTVRVTVEGCPPELCTRDLDVRICLDDDFEYDLSEFVECIPMTSDGNQVSVSYAITSQSADPDFVASLDGSTLSFTTRSASEEGVHAGAIVVTASTASPCSSSALINVNITLIDCGCPCPDDEADYTICDNNYDNEEYVADGKLNNTEQIPFSLTNEGGQTLRKGQPYIVSKGKIDCD